MSKVGLVLLGILLAVGAFSFGGYRHVYKPHFERSATSSQAKPGQVPAATRGVQPAQRPGPAGGQTTSSGASSISTAQMFDWGLNIANLLVGVIGIGMAMRGMRSRR